jgi:hypothetical protein
MSNPVIDSKHMYNCEAQTPMGVLYYTIYYDFSELSQEAYINHIDITLPTGEVIPLPPKKYGILYNMEEEFLTKAII